MGGGNAPLNLIPRLQKIATKNTNFSITNEFGGIRQVFGTQSTLSGTTAYLCGVPINIPINLHNFQQNKYFLSSATCISDVLDSLGYKQAYFSSADLKFAGTRNLLNRHKIEVLDSKYFEQKGILPKKLPKSMRGVWGVKDSVIFNLAKDYLNDTTEPFALYISTIDTHTPYGFVDKENCTTNLEDSPYESAYLCTDKIVSAFVDYVQNSRFKDNTTIVILGDHLTWAPNFVTPHTTRFVFNAFINAKFTKHALDKTKYRTLSHFDITPLILDSVGLRVESFGLGRNPFYQKSLIESEYDINSFNDELKLRNKVYDSLWDAK